MYTREQLETKIKSIDETLAAGVTSVTTDGTTTTVDLAQLRLERKELRRQLDALGKQVMQDIRLG